MFVSGVGQMEIMIKLESSSGSISDSEQKDDVLESVDEKVKKKVKVND